MKTFYLIIVFTIISSSISANMRKADKMFERWEYASAVTIYEKHAARHPLSETYYKIGECYRYMNHYKQAEAAYRNVSDPGKVEAAYHLHYGQVLQNNGKYAEAKVEFEKYDLASPGNKVGRFHRESIELVTDDHKWDEMINMQNVSALNSPSSDFCPVPYRNGLVFASSRERPSSQVEYRWSGTPYLDLYIAQKGSNGVDYGNVQPLDGELNQRYHDGPATFSSDFNTMYFSRVEKQLKGKENRIHDIERCMLYKSEYTDGKWSEPEAFAYNSNSYSVANPYLSRDGSRLYFSSDMEGGYGETDIYYCLRQSDGSWGQPVNMGASVNTFNTEKFPNEDSAGNFYFASNGFQGFGGLDICVALNKGGNLEKAIPMKYPFNSPTDDFGIIFLKEQRSGYITSNRYAGGTGDDDIYYFDLDKDDVAPTLEASIYTIGYRPPLKPIAVVEPRDSILDITPLPATFIGSIYFDLDKSNLRVASQRTLDSIVTYMQANPEKRVVLGGHCDIRGAADYNQKLSVRRNDAAVVYLNTHGIPKNRISATAYGFERLSNGCDHDQPCTEAQHQQNRRVEYRFE